MKNIIRLVLFMGIVGLNAPVKAQYAIEPVEGFTPQIGVVVDMLEEIKNRIEANVQDLSLAETDFRFDDRANSIGALIMHLAATEAYYQIETLEGNAWSAEEMALWGAASDLGGESRETFTGKPIAHYLDIWDTVREKTLGGLKSRDDAWLASEIEEGVNNHWVWFHVLEHASAHMGQIALVKQRLPD